ncbi:MAG: nitrite/sulfite reductase [Planctomycetes bacterium]|nr:nitrite/sulfite reductase [Planctomycetota bacterium]
MKASKPEPLFKTPADQLNEVEQAKLASDMVRGTLHDDFADHVKPDLEHDSEALAKSHGIYLEYNRAKTGKEKDWMYMVRITVPGGGAFTRDQWRVFDDISTKYTANAQGLPSLRATTRQNIQFHWVKKPHVAELVREIAHTGFFTLNGCGDNVRNVMGCPLARFSTIYDANAHARKFGEYFRISAEAHIQVFEVDTSLIRTPDSHFEYAPNLLNRKFKMAFAAVHRDEKSGRWVNDNCVELRTNEVGVAPIVDQKTDKVVAFQVYIGGGQGERNGKPTYSALGKPLGIFTEENLHVGLDSIVKVQQEWGDRKNRHWARMKYVVQAMGISWYQERIKELGAVFEQPDPNFDIGPRMMHHGWQKQPSNGLWAYGAYIENGRIINAANGNLKTMVRSAMEKFPKIELMLTPNQDLLFVNIPEAAKADFEAELRSHGHGQRNGKAYTKLRVLSGACVGLDTCRLSYSESEKYEPELVDEMDALGYGATNESIGISGCERQCFRPATKTIGLVGCGPDLYSIKLGASEDARHQGEYLAWQGRWYLKQTPRERMPQLIAALFDLHKKQGASDPDLGATIRRIGFGAVVDYLKSHPVVGDLMVKTHDAPYVPDEIAVVTGLAGAPTA